MSEAPKEIWCSMGLYYDYKKELEAENKSLRLEAAHANDTADAAIERMKEMEAIIDYQNKRSETLAEGWKIRGGKQMLEEVYKYLAGTGDEYDFEDAIVVVKLRGVLKCYKSELTLLQKRAYLHDGQIEDMETYKKDVAALEHVLKLFDWKAHG
jgi:hypothetical protein